MNIIESKNSIFFTQYSKLTVSQIEKLNEDREFLIRSKIEEMESDLDSFSTIVKMEASTSVKDYLKILTPLFSEFEKIETIYQEAQGTHPNKASKSYDKIEEKLLSLSCKILTYQINEEKVFH
jgi:hypothetical protein